LHAAFLAITIRGMTDPNKKIAAKFVGGELYFDDLKRARAFYADVLWLQVLDEDETRYAKFEGGAGFVCLERKGSESYPSQDKAVLLFEVPDLAAAVAAIGEDRIVQREAKWAVLHDPEGHNILLLQR
jgi:predicted enzyme related to lactoylglutathione lyase